MTKRHGEAALIAPTGRSIDEIDAEVRDAQREHLEPDELARLWTALDADPFWLGYFKFQYHFGCRNSEVALLLKEEVSLDKGLVVLRRLKKRDVPTVRCAKCGKVGAAGRGDDEKGWFLRQHNAEGLPCPGSRVPGVEVNRKRKYPGGFEKYSYPLPPKLVETMRAAHAVVPKGSPWFFGSAVKADGRDRYERTASMRIGKDGWRAVARSTAQKWFTWAAASAGIPGQLCHTHVLRHTRATLLFATNVTEAQVQRLLGHSSPTITRRYMHWAESIQQRADLMAILAREEE